MAEGVDNLIWCIHHGVLMTAVSLKTSDLSVGSTMNVGLRTASALIKDRLLDWDVFSLVAFHYLHFYDEVKLIERLMSDNWLHYEIEKQPAIEIIVPELISPPSRGRSDGGYISAYAPNNQATLKFLRFIHSKSNSRLHPPPYCLLYKTLLWHWCLNSDLRRLQFKPVTVLSEAKLCWTANDRMIKHRHMKLSNRQIDLKYLNSCL